MPFLHANGINIYYERHGSGEPLVLIAGLGYDHWMWYRMIPLLAEHLEVIAFDNRGVGKTDKPEGPYTAELLAEDTDGLLAGLDIAQAAVLGHSMGGYVAQELALSRPELVSKLILSATNFGGPHQIPVTPEAMAVLTDIRSDPVERFKRGIQVSCAPGFAESQPEILAEWLDYRTHHPLEPAPYQAQLAVGLGLLPEQACFEPRLKHIQAPTLILFGEHDQVVPPANAELLAQRIPDSRVKILSGAGHFFPIEMPEAAVDAIVEFLR